MNRRRHAGTEWEGSTILEVDGARSNAGILRLLGLAAALALLMALLLARAAQAQELPGRLVPGPAGFTVLLADPAQPGSEPAAPLGQADPNAPLDDGGSWEVGLEGSAGNLPAATAAERAGMWFWLNGWFVRKFNFNEATAWEEDFKRAALGGTENQWLDSVDLMFYVGHGSPGLFTFDNASHDDSTMNASNDCNTAWGDVDNEWLALTSCQVLSGSGVSSMAQCMNRQHLILGFVTNASAHNNANATQAYHFGRYMRFGYNMTQSWFKACDVADRGRTVRVIAEETACFNDNPYFSSVCADVLDNDYYWWTHDCGTPSAGPVPDALLQGAQLPVIKLEPYTDADADADFERLTTIFSLPITPTTTFAPPAGASSAPQAENPPSPPLPTGTPFRVSIQGNQIFQLDTSSGLYEFSNLDELWSAPAADAALAAAAAAGPNAAVSPIDARVVRAFADRFLGQNGLFDQGAVFAEVVTDSLGNVQERATVLDNDAILRLEIPTGYQVIYSRQLLLSPVTAAGAVPVTVTVVGPGAKLKVYVPTSVTTPGAAGDPAPLPTGMQGGWRNLAVVDSSAGNAADAVMVQSIPANTVAELFLALGDQVAMASTPISISEQTILTTTLSYWENPLGVSQTELIPVYQFDVEITDANTGVQSIIQTYVPAASSYLMPIAQIISGTTTSGQLVRASSLLQTSALVPGGSFVVTAADSSKTLAELGLGSQFTFQAGIGPYRYDWYLGDPIPPNKIPGCTGLTCTVPIPLTFDSKGGQLVVNLVVTDLGSPNLSQSTDSAAFEVLPTASWLPIVSNP